MPALSLDPLEPRRLLSAAVPLGNLALSEGPNYTPGSSSSAAFNGAIYYAVTPIQTRTELWKTDGTPGGMTMVKAFNTVALPTGLYPPPVANFAVSGDQLFFTVGAVRDNASVEVWRTDGTTAGTTRVSSFFYPGTAYSPSLTDVGGTLYYAAPGVSQGGSSLPALWKTDGTAAGTKQVATSPSQFQPPRDLFAAGTTLFYSADQTYKIAPAGGGVVSPATAAPGGRSVAMLDGVLYFISGSQFNSGSLYRYDGAGTAQVVTAVDTSGRVPELVAMGHQLYFSNAGPGGKLAELWQSDGTAAGTHLLKDIHPTYQSYPSHLTAVGDTLYFAADDGIHGTELWKSDGTEAGTVLVADPTPGTTSSGLDNLTAAGDTLYYSARSAAGGVELWRATPDAGAAQVADLYTGPGGSMPHEFFTVGQTLYFQATSSLAGYGLFSATGAAGGVTPVADYFAGYANGPTTLAPLPGGQVLFTAGTGSVTGRELYTTDGTPGGTGLLRNIYPQDWNDSSPTGLTSSGGVVYFAATNYFLTGVELWKSDGTPDGTVLVKDINTSTTSVNNGSDPARFVDVNGTVYFTADAHTTFQSTPVLWRSDGTAAGTTTVNDPSRALNVLPGFNWGGVLYLIDDGNLSKYAPSTPSVTGVKGFRSLTTQHGGISGIAVANNAIWMGASDETTASVSNVELWKSDGTTAGTVLIKDINTNTDSTKGTRDSSPAGFTGFQNAVYFRAFDPTHGYELWKSDGTANGTVLVKEISAGTASSNPANFVAVGNTLLFTADDGLHGVELWQTDGTANGTKLFADLFPGPLTSNPANFTPVGNVVYFTADDGLGGRRLFVTDGTLAGTHALTLPGSNPLNLTNVNGTLYYTANDGVTGPALYRWDPVAPAPAVTAAAFSPDGPAPAVTFDFTLAATLHPADLRLRNLTTGQSIDPATFRLAINPAGNRAILTFAAPLPDGDYRLTLPAGALRDTAGVANAADVTTDFFSLAGDANHDRTVDFNDLVTLAQNYNTSGPGKTFADGDFNYDGSVDFGDLVILAQRYNTGLGAPAPAAAAPFDQAWTAARAGAITPPPAPTKTTTSRPKPAPVFADVPVKPAKKAPAKRLRQ